MANPFKLDLLIVDDEESTRVLLSQIFQARGINVRCAADGFEALYRIQEAAPDVLLSDLNMPGMTGFELLSVVRRLYPQIHVIATSGAYSGVAVPTGIAADGFHEKATGMARLFGLIFAADEDKSHSMASRTVTPLWVDLEPSHPLGERHVLINCNRCLRPFRESVTEVHSRIRETACVYCQASVSYALAFAVKPRDDGRSENSHLCGA